MIRGRGILGNDHGMDAQARRQISALREELEMARGERARLREELEDAVRGARALAMLLGIKYDGKRTAGWNLDRIRKSLMDERSQSNTRVAQDVEAGSGENSEVPVADLLVMLRRDLLREGYDGLYIPRACSCSTEDLAPCGFPCELCRPGRLAASNAEGVVLSEQNMEHVA